MTKDIPVDETLLTIQIKGLKSDPTLLTHYQEKAIRLLNVYRFKTTHRNFPLIFGLMGGTGTGKSFLFNQLTHSSISKTGVERPSTLGGIVHTHEDHFKYISLSEFPWSGEKIKRTQKQMTESIGGQAGSLTMIFHTEASAESIIIDSPDLDSILEVNRETSEGIYSLADCVLFITTPEKYADLQPTHILKQAREQKKSVWVILNKSNSQIEANDIYQQLTSWGLSNDFSFMTIHHMASGPDFMNTIDQLRETLQTFSKQQKRKIRTQEIAILSQQLAHVGHNIDQLINEENKAFQYFISILDKAHDYAMKRLQKEIKALDTNALNMYLKPQIQKVYQQHDLLAPIRNILTATISFPFRLLGIKSAPDILPYQKKPSIESTPIYLALSGYQLEVAQKVNHPMISKAFQDNNPDISQTEANDLLYEGSQKIFQWLEVQFNELNKGIPSHKRMGMHALSIIWGVAIIGLETITGGGITLAELAIDSLIAPYITGSTTEFFVVNELKVIVNTLQKKYLLLLNDILQKQHQQYSDIVNTFKPGPISKKIKNGLMELTDSERLA